MTHPTNGKPTPTEYHVNLFEASERYYILESGRLTSSGTGGSASEADVRAAMAI
jgi:urea transport system ATP-binding protein